MKNIQFDFSNMLAAPGGLTCEDIRRETGKLARVHEALCAGEADMAWRALPLSQLAGIQDMTNTAKAINEKFEAFVVLGIGGSALGPKMLFNALKHLRHNELPREKRGGVRYYVAENVDPDGLRALFDVIEPEKTCFNVITKSGNTVETLAQFLTVLALLEKKLGKNFADHMIITTDAGSAMLRKIAADGGFKTFTVPEGVGGRYSVLSPVGLLSAAVLGIDLAELLKGAEEMHQACKLPDLYENPAYLYALLLCASLQKGKNIQVLMPYSDSLLYFADWYLQLWAESLGKRYDRTGREILPGRRAGAGRDRSTFSNTALRGRAFDKVITFLEAASFKTTLPIGSPSMEVYEAGYLAAQTFNKLIASELRATEYAVTKAGRPQYAGITLDEVNPYTMGALVMFLKTAAAAMGEFLQINAFDQPGVEAGKRATFALMGKEGYGALADELNACPDKDERLLISFSGIEK